MNARRDWAKLAQARQTWSSEDVAALRAAYAAKNNEALDLDGLAARLGRTRHSVCQKAASLGLTDHRRAGVAAKKVRRMFATDEDLRRHQSEVRKHAIAVNGHPRGMLGKSHSEETKARLRETSTAAMAAATPGQLAARSLKALQTREANGTEFTPRLTASWKAGWRVIGGIRKFYRSRWEANYARYLEWLKQRGEILDWKHEPKTFWFVGVRRGAVSYLPDFWVRERNGAEAFHEVKGWLDDRSKTKLRRMKKYHPTVKVVVIRQKQYRAIAWKVAVLIHDWEVGRRMA